MLEQLIAQYQVLKSILDSVQKEAAEGSTSWDIMACKSLVGDTAEERMAYLTSQKNQLASLEIQIEEAKKQAAESQKAVAPATPVEPVKKAELQVKSWAHDNPLVELTKGLFDNEDFRDLMKSPAGSQMPYSKQFNDFSVLKAVSDAATIQYGNVIQALITPIEAIDTAVMMPNGTEVYRARRASRVGAAARVRNSDAATPSGSKITPANYALADIMGYVHIDRHAAMADMTVLMAYAQMMFEDVRLEWQEQMLAGDGSGANLSSIQAQVGASFTTTYTASNPPTAYDAVKTAILSVRGRGGTANVVFAGAVEVGKIYAELEDKDGTFADAKMLPYGSPMGAALILAPQVPANTIIVGSMGNPRFHCLPVMGGVEVNTDYSVAFASNEIAMRGNVFGQSVVELPGAFQILAGANHLT